ncbi:hypothetical protein H4R18_002746 [Coemansia javaensis]|uniref:Uncharacterized protein n=1 Tax=Coemansia javaensis TaxID=2761396 RepID=A0A9W8H8V1_9FUNG|nr:hypothetical protein H4R18_002746 [Coemansia javaensis]
MLDVPSRHSPSQAGRRSPSASLEELESRLRDLCSKPPVPLPEEPHGRQHHRSASGETSSSSATLDDSECVQYGSGPPAAAEAALAEWRFDICRWARQANTKPEVLLRRNGGSGRKAASPLFELSRPAAVDELLGRHPVEPQTIGEFMAQHASLEPFMPYVIESGHALPPTPSIAPVNDQATRHLPPLAREEYSAHVSRITYLVRSLQAIEAADPGFLSQTRVHLLLDLVMDLERHFTLPRVDFLRSHANTVRAIGARTGCAPQSGDASSCLVGCVGDWAGGAPPDVAHLKHMAYAVPHHSRFRRSTTNATAESRTTATTAADAQSSNTTNGTSILGAKLQPDSAFWAGLRESNFADMPPPPILGAPPAQPSRSAPDVALPGTMQRQNASRLRQPSQPAAYVAVAPRYNPSLQQPGRPLSTATSFASQPEDGGQPHPYASSARESELPRSPEEL